ncbi:ATP-dependent DNA helicase PIF1-like protein [Tanacetum coccineum]|uniref:ATP-dependent DNA helicase PIF1-like protein n=1 Tax=Tanacetum coccineum TaxID=301880 RepID=A0ABQ5HV84_9ASTR
MGIGASRYPELQLTDDQIMNYCLVEIEALQILPVIPKGKGPEVVQACINRSELWKSCKEEEDEESWIEIPEEFIIKSTKSPINKIVKQTFPGFATRKSKDEYLKERAILTPRNDDVDAINAYMFKMLPDASVTYNGADKVCKASTDTLDQQHLYPIEFLNSLNFLGMPPHALSLKRNYP